MRRNCNPSLMEPMIRRGDEGGEKDFGEAIINGTGFGSWIVDLLDSSVESKSDFLDFFAPIILVDGIGDRLFGVFHDASVSEKRRVTIDRRTEYKDDSEC